MLKAPDTLGDVGPGFFPLLIGIGMAVLGAVLAFVPVRRATASDAAPRIASATTRLPVMRPEERD